MARFILLSAALLVTPVSASDPAAMQSAYQQAAQFFYPNVRPLVLNAELPFYWQQQGYWFSRQEVDGRHFYFADSLQQTLQQLDMAELSRALGADATLDADKLQIRLSRTEQHWQARLQYEQQSWRCQLASAYQCQMVAAPTAVISPDQRWQLDSVGHNLQLTDVNSGQTQQLTTDGSADYAWGELNDWYQLDSVNGVAQPPQRGTRFVWSDDSRFAATFVLDRRTMPTLHMLQNLPQQGYSAVLHSYKRALPGDDQRSHYQLAIVDTQSGKVSMTQLPPLETTQNWGDVSWHDDGFFYLVARARGMRAHYALVVRRLRALAR